VKQIWGAGTGLLDSKSRLEEMGFIGCLKVDNFSSEQMCMGREFQADCVEAEKTLAEKMLVMQTNQITLLQL